MKSRIDILNELNELSPVIAQVGNANVFTVPAGYFEKLGDDILMLVKKGHNELPGGLSTQVSLQVPQGYFESLADNILNNIKVLKRLKTV